MRQLPSACQWLISDGGLGEVGVELVMQSQTTIKNETSYLTVAQLAKRLQISESTIYGWVDRDYIPFLMAGDLLRFDANAIDAWMSAEADRKREKKRTLNVRMVK